MSPATVEWVLVALAGLVVGSFLNVCIHRLPLGGSVASPPSQCPRCGAGIRWYDNVPVLSYLLLRGRCRGCRVAISPVYPLVETVVAGLFVLHWVVFGWQPLLAVRLVFACALVVLFMIDLRHHILPNRITLPGIGVGLACSLVAPPGWLSATIGAVAGGGVLFVIAESYYRIRGEEGLGMGDVKMLAMIGAFLGWQQMIVTLILSSVAGSVVGIGLLASGRGGLKYALPFGTFLALGALAASLVGDLLWWWYVSFYLLGLTAIVLLGLTAIVGALIAILVFAVLRLRGAALRRRRAQGEQRRA
ncbi:MAG: A24 family peptidase [Vicinamibacterales bacterium]|nr:prepilin peptidase [Acidobacteriota bacterium]MDP7472581.1 A24 family peptidase [Vicinamibacterales bacterium]MDP7672178.1 A24 family peptidase [Vicinamibacterales bacterium]HJO37420.1 A24 family peptidase [Vicinamibacterales bacterium]